MISQRKSPPVDVFISARSSDYPQAERIYELLRQNGLSVFFSKASLPEMGTSDYRKAIDKALEEARHMVVVASSAQNVMSSWVEAEWGAFINEKRSGRKTGNLITVVSEGLRVSDLPMSLRYYEVIPFDDDGLRRLLSFVTEAGAVPTPEKETFPEPRSGPALAFEYNAREGWILKNIGTAPALDIVVAMMAERGTWERPVRVPPLGPGERFQMTWLGHSNVDSLGAAYSDQQGNKFSAICRHDLTRIEPGNVIGEWTEDRIKRHWNA